MARTGKAHERHNVTVIQKAAVTIGLLVVAACGAEDGSTSTTGVPPTITLAPTTLAVTTTVAADVPPDVRTLDSGPAAPGKYRTVNYEPQVAFTVDRPGWVVSPPDLPGDCAVDGCTFGLAWPDDPTFDAEFFPLISVLTLRGVSEGVDTDDALEIVPVPDDLLGFFHGGQHHDAGDIVEARVGNTSGHMFDSIITSAPVETSTIEERGAPWRLGRIGEDVWWVAVGEKVRWIVLDVDGEQVLILIETHPDEFDRFMEIAQPLLDSFDF